MIEETKLMRRPEEGRVLDFELYRYREIRVFRNVVLIQICCYHISKYRYVSWIEWKAILWLRIFIVVELYSVNMLKLYRAEDCTDTTDNKVFWTHKVMDLLSMTGRA